MHKEIKKKAVDVNRKWMGIYMKFPNDAYSALLKLEDETGKNRTVLFADYVTERRQFPPELESLIEAERVRRKLSSRRSTVAALLGEAVKFLETDGPNAKQA